MKFAGFCLGPGQGRLRDHTAVKNRDLAAKAMDRAGPVGRRGPLSGRGDSWLEGGGMYIAVAGNGTGRRYELRLQQEGQDP